MRYEPGLTNAVHLLKGSDTFIWLTIREARGEHDAEAARLVQEVADLAGASGLRVALYPHRGYYMATADDALRIVKLAGRKNVGVTINLCHELMAGNADRLPALIKACAPHLFLVSINGASRGTTFKETIKVLGQGEFDVPAFLTLLDQAGYAGPIGLQCFDLKGDPRENLSVPWLRGVSGGFNSRAQRLGGAALAMVPAFGFGHGGLLCLAAMRKGILFLAARSAGTGSQSGRNPCQ